MGRRLLAEVVLRQYARVGRRGMARGSEAIMNPGACGPAPRRRFSPLWWSSTRPAATSPEQLSQEPTTGHLGVYEQARRLFSARELWKEPGILSFPRLSRRVLSRPALGSVSPRRRGETQVRLASYRPQPSLSLESWRARRGDMTRALWSVATPPRITGAIPSERVLKTRPAKRKSATAGEGPAARLSLSTYFAWPRLPRVAAGAAY